MKYHTAFIPLRLSLTEKKTWIFSALFVIGSLLLPQLTHFVPKGGLIFLPIYFFTLIAAYKFGPVAGLLTAIIAPLSNHLLFGMPPASMLPIIFIKSGLLVVFASLISRNSKSFSILHLMLVVLGYQIAGCLIGSYIFDSFFIGFQDFRIGLPGMFIQIIGGWMLLKSLANYGR